MQDEFFTSEEGGRSLWRDAGCRLWLYPIHDVIYPQPTSGSVSGSASLSAASICFFDIDIDCDRDPIPMLALISCSSISVADLGRRV